MEKFLKTYTKLLYLTWVDFYRQIKDCSFYNKFSTNISKLFCKY